MVEQEGKERKGQSSVVTVVTSQWQEGCSSTRTRGRQGRGLDAQELAVFCFLSWMVITQKFHFQPFDNTYGLRSFMKVSYNSPRKLFNFLNFKMFFP